MDFEKKLSELEKIVKNMEEGNLNLEESLKSFEEGIKLSRQCQAQLEKASLRVKELLSINEKGESQTKSFETS